MCIRNTQITVTHLYNHKYITNGHTTYLQTHRLARGWWKGRRLVRLNGHNHYTSGQLAITPDGARRSNRHNISTDAFIPGAQSKMRRVRIYSIKLFCRLIYISSSMFRRTDINGYKTNKSAHTNICLLPIALHAPLINYNSLIEVCLCMCASVFLFVFVG